MRLLVTRPAARRGGDRRAGSRRLAIRSVIAPMLETRAAAASPLARTAGGDRCSPARNALRRHRGARQQAADGETCRSSASATGRRRQPGPPAFAHVRSAEWRCSATSLAVDRGLDRAGAGPLLYPAATRAQRTSGRACCATPAIGSSSPRSIAWSRSTSCPSRRAAALAEGRLDGVLLYSRRTAETLRSPRRGGGLDRRSQRHAMLRAVAGYRRGPAIRRGFVSPPSRTKMLLLALAIGTSTRRQC